MHNWSNMRNKQMTINTCQFFFWGWVGGGGGGGGVGGGGGGDGGYSLYKGR